jgi:putative two-component system response regulator
MGMSLMSESHDKVTGAHIGRIKKFAHMLSIHLADIYPGLITDDQIESIAMYSPLHDIGKIAISDLILNKPDTLTREEFNTIKTHVCEGEKIIDSIILESGDDAFLHYAKLFVGHHHERWDGTGYPRGLKGRDISLQGRIMAIIDVYDALISGRPYKKGFSHDETVKIITESRDTHFDPAIVDVFLEIENLFKEVLND